MVNLTDYEVERQRRIQENKERMEMLGLTQTINDMQTTIVTERTEARKQRAARKAAISHAVSVPGRSRRRSERVQGQPAPVYDERELSRMDLDNRPKLSKSSRARLTDNINEEIYGMEHVAALGDSTQDWELFADGFGPDGKRIYDKVNGQTCHQCRQKTMGKRTACSDCGTLNGVFCGDCLFMRYGENIDEVNENPDWICPHCRDLCNCSFHRSRRGWAPTGTLYRRVLKEGYKSVAHYLVLTNLEDEAKEAALPFMPAELAEKNKNKELAGGDSGGDGENVAMENEEEFIDARSNHDDEVAVVVGRKKRGQAKVQQQEGGSVDSEQENAAPPEGGAPVVKKRRGRPPGSGKKVGGKGGKFKGKKGGAVKKKGIKKGKGASGKKKATVVGVRQNLRSTA